MGDDLDKHSPEQNMKLKEKDFDDLVAFITYIIYQATFYHTWIHFKGWDDWYALKYHSVHCGTDWL